MAIDKTTFIPKLWEASILRSLEKDLVATHICTTDFTGEIKKYGDTVHFPSLADPTISKYEGTINYEELANTDTALVIDQKDYFAFKVDDIDEAQANVGVENSQTQRAGYKLRDQCDQYLLGLYTDAEHSVESTAVTSANVLSLIGEMAKKLDEANVPNEQKWIVIPPWLKLKLRLAGISFSIKEGTSQAKSGLEWTKELGFDLYVSNNVADTSGAYHCMGGSKNAIAFADQLLKTRAMPLENSFAVGVSGLHVYGAKVIKPEELVVGNFTEANETAI